MVLSLSTAVSAGAAGVKIEVNGLKKSFASDKGPLPVIGGVSFGVADGEFVAIVGPSGEFRGPGR